MKSPIVCLQNDVNMKGNKKKQCPDKSHSWLFGTLGFKFQNKIHLVSEF